MASGAVAQQQVNPAAEFLKQLNLPSGMGQVWEGTITFTQNDSKNKHIDESAEKHRKETVDKRSIDAIAIVRFCGSGHFYVSHVQRTWQEQWEQGHIDAYSETICARADADGKSNTEPVSPGNEDSDEESGRGVLCPQAEKNQNGGKTVWFDENNYDLKPKGARVSMVPAPVHGGYWLDAAVEVFVNYSSKAESLQKDVCSGKRKLVQRVMTTIPFSQTPQSYASGGEDNPTYSFQAHPVSRKFALHKHIVLADGQETIKGSWPLVEETADVPGEWNRLLVAEWDLRMKNFCNDVFDALYSDLAVAEAYNDPNLRNRTGDIKSYNNMVFQQAWHTYKSNNPDPYSNTSLHMSAGKRSKDGKVECYVSGKEKAKQSLKERCLPDVIFDAVYAHERRHMKQCAMDPAMFPPTNVDKVGVYETDAYLAGIRKYISWLELNCPNDNRLAVAKDRLAALKANRNR